ncbi:MAG: VWA domain-containing protein [Gammaproteobacteria bacterium]|nr:VWA domain-containing protein [Gammaproteobacteria bacterium]MDH5302530.1 VWA domain-containing protein [Gammaproteobacteria bacterium]MDH5321922.1 VWA domain-containing protein [Gammaproteobacteria bacterium]
MKRRRNVEAFSLSFLDCICCGFGAIILLLVLSKIYEPVIIEKTQDDLESLIALLQQELFDIRGQTTVLNRDLENVRLQTSDSKLQLARLQGELETVRGQYAATVRESESEIDEGALRVTRQRLTEEMRRLAPYYRRASDDAVAGIPVDSEYVIFIVDTSGSMQQYNWDRAIQKLNETLDVYPQVKGLQIMNDNGSFMFQQYAGKWIPDTPGRREAIINTMRNWRPFSDSNPADGIIYAISTFWSAEKKISVYVFGDEFSGGSVESVIRQIESVNRIDASGNRLVRIHAVGFPYFFEGGREIPDTARRFAQLMRVLCDRNGGTFVALSDPRS